MLRDAQTYYLRVLTSKKKDLTPILDPHSLRINKQLAIRDRCEFIDALLADKGGWLDIEKALDQAQADANLRNKALYPLQQLKASVAALSSIPKIRYLAEQAGNHLDTAMDLIASTQKPTPGGVTETGGSSTTVISTGNTPPTLAAKPVKVIRASDCNVKTYLETESDVEAYLAKLRNELLATIREGKKARIQ